MLGFGGGVLSKIVSIVNIGGIIYSIINLVNAEEEIKKFE